MYVGIHMIYLFLIQVLFVEHYWIPEGGEVLKKFLGEKGFEVVKETSQDYLFKKK